ncbi:hypothetical protein NFI96_026490 [Prochilodus magdalenae]|nr:hypothetical protein NFI96_026490 [Prochilodus magdalenae]
MEKARSLEDVSSSASSKQMEGVFHSHLDERVRPYIDLIDSLRLLGIEEDLALPTIAVIGDQSSGKSSVLEALSGVALPRGSGIVTRCPLELKLRKIKGGVQWRAAISYKDEHIEFDDPSLVEGYVEEAQNELAGDGVGICDDLITLEIMSPDVCDLTLIDLPGIARVPVKGQPDDIGDQIKNLIQSFIKKSETINLVVVPCNVDIATTEALKMAQEVDPEGQRTLAILTKPDLVDRGTEKNILDIVRNQVIPLSKGYIIVKCRGQKQIDEKISLAEATRVERDFFKRHEHFSCLLNEDKASIHCLATKLTQDLVDHIKKLLPPLSVQINKQLWDLRKELSQCEAGPPLDPQKRKSFFINTLMKFNDKINRMASGEAGDEDNLFVQLRTEFKQWKDHLDSTKPSFHEVVQAVVQEYDLKYRGRDLPGFSNYNVFETVVQRLVIKLKESAIERLRAIRGMFTWITHVFYSCCTDTLYPLSLLLITQNKIDNIQSKQEAKVEQRILEQFEMEQLVYTQDGIYFKTFNETPPSEDRQKASQDSYAGLDTRSKYPEMLHAYYEIVVQRLADQVPMLIQYFMLKESAQLLCSEMLGLMDGANVNNSVTPAIASLIMENDGSSFEEVSSASENGKQMEGVFHSHLDERVRPYIDLIDSLRLLGIEEDLALPTIAVIGDQSSGKSSVLEALSGVALPRGSGIVTRCPLELKLRKIRGGVHWRAAISYKEEYIEFDDPSLVEGYVEEAQNELAGDGVGICDDLITLEIMSPDVCDLTLIDLPGIARVPVKGQPDDIGDQIKHLIQSFIEKSETINLVVVPCNVDIATTEALKMAQEVDPEGKRTLAILTKPDLVDKGTEKNVLDVVRNQVIPLSKGYIIVKCRGQKQIDEKISLAEATRVERDFFKRHEHFGCLLNEEKATVQCLATKLTQDLVDHIKKSLPLLSEQIKKQLWDLRKDLSQCEAGPPLDPQKRKEFFITTLMKFNDKINRLASGEGDYDDNLFVQLRIEFKKWKDQLDSTKASFHGMVQSVVKEYDQKYRGRELPGFSNYNVFETVVQRLVIQLKGPAIDTLRVIRETIQKHFSDVSTDSFPNYPFLQCVATNKIDNIQSKQEAKVEQRILEQFEMEELVYTQDGLYTKTLNETQSSGISEDNFAGLDSRNMYPEMLRAYYEIVVQRLADQVPMLIRYFMLKESAQLLCREMLGLMDGANITEVLREESEVSRRRVNTQNRLDRLSIAQEKLSNFI